ncbi:uncharacterized protein LOC103315503 isoform X2 [Nasonia vitripennis]|uniref:Uncharacterized protein n=1 Tax=Nasonia vitripennis TaxID=7425 RepID=A0A7M7ITY5_NASVI|nr:uncharacterized protein LOC103315503 isoform X2 [Nasonia vitripennis]
MTRRDDHFCWHSSNSYYCEEQRKLRETYWKIVRNYDRNPESLSSSHDGQLSNDASSTDRRRRGIVEQNRDSPVSPCLKTLGKKSGVKKRVNFYKEKAETTSQSSSSYYRLPRNTNHSSPRHSSTANSEYDSYNSISTDLYDLHCSGPGHPRAHGSPSRKSSKNDSGNEERRLLERLSGLSLHSPSRSSLTCCSSRKKPEPSQPRLYRPKDCLKRAAVRRMLVYPPEGQTGPPLTLRRSCSNIDCRVTGDPDNGYRYKVYYLQKFESDSWFPADDKTGSPFHRLEEDCSTDYG